MPKTRIFKLLLALSTFLFVFPSCMIAFSAYNSYLQFDSPLYCDKIGFDKIVSNTKIYFYNSLMD